MGSVMWIPLILLGWLLSVAYRVLVNVPDKSIGQQYLDRWYIIPRNRFLNIYLHHFQSDDDDRALHDHPWWSVSFLLAGGVREVVPKGDNERLAYKGEPGITRNTPKQFVPYFRKKGFIHRIILITPTAWTLFITGPIDSENGVGVWGFYCPKGWVHWKRFTDESGTQIGAGCGEE